VPTVLATSQLANERRREPWAKPNPAARAADVPPLVASPELFADSPNTASNWNSQPQEIIAWAVQKYFPRLTMATALAPRVRQSYISCAGRTADARLQSRHRLPVSGKARARDRIAQKYGIEVRDERPETVGDRVRGPSTVGRL